MNEGLQKALTDLISRLTNAIDGVSVQIPDLVKDMIAFQIVNTWVWMGFYLLLAVICTSYLVWFIWAIWRGKWDDWDENGSIGIIVLVLIAMIGFVVTVHSIVDCSTTLIALYYHPNVWVVSYLRGML